MQAFAIGHGPRGDRLEQQPVTSSARSSISVSTIAISSVHRILTRHGMHRLPANQKDRAHSKRWQEKPQPGHRLQLDVKFLERIPGSRRRLYQFTVIDDCTRIRVLKVYDACNQRTAIRFIVVAAVGLSRAGTLPTSEPGSDPRPK